MVKLYLFSLTLILLGSHGVTASANASMTPQSDPSELAELTNGNNTFALNVYDTLVRSTDDNIFLSPYSISSALAMTYGGARHQTEQEMAATLNLGRYQEQNHSGFKALNSAIRAAKDTDGYEINIANRLWGQTGFRFKQAFVRDTEAYYGAGLETLDFVSHTEQARLRINDWVAEETADRIKDLLPDGALTQATRLVLTNAVYFLAEWEQKFDGALTADAPFHLLDGSQTNAEIMNQVGDFAYHYDQALGAHIVKMPYMSLSETNKSASMVLLVPEAKDGLTQMENGLTAEILADALRAAKPHHVTLSLPKFKIEESFSLPDVLKALGMVDAFSKERADFTNMAILSADQNLFISDVLHKTFIELDESGTEAAGATAVIISITSTGIPMPDVKVNADHPFMFLIRDDQTGSILFLGRLTKPVS